MNINEKEVYELNKVQMEIFREFIRVCNILELKYYAIHGTLLGAVRFNGFFPYDDDIDVCMPRKDYEKFIREGIKLLDNKYFWQSIHTEENYPLVFTKLKNSDTTYIQSNLKKLDINHGIFIDIFPLDYYPSNKLVQKEIDFLNRLANIRIESLFDEKRKMTLRRKIIRIVASIVYPNYKNALCFLEGQYKNFSEGNYYVIHGGKNSDKLLPREWFDEEEFLMFENQKIRVPGMYRDYLKHIYGDYMQYLPSDKYKISDNVVSISAEVLDTNKSYKYYQ